MPYTYKALSKVSIALKTPLIRLPSGIHHGSLDSDIALGLLGPPSYCLGTSKTSIIFMYFSRFNCFIKNWKLEYDSVLLFSSTILHASWYWKKQVIIEQVKIEEGWTFSIRCDVAHCNGLQGHWIQVVSSHGSVP